MARFTVRVELHDGEGMYDDLHEEMEERKFKKTIKNDKTGKVYELPEAEYNIEGDFTKYVVLNKAKAAVAAIELTASILVTESLGRTWSGLEEA